MPSIMHAMESTNVVFATQKQNAKAIPNVLVVDNYTGSGTNVITLVDRFTPSVTNGTASPSETTVNRLRITVDNGSLEIIGDELKNIEILGQTEVSIATAMDSGCYVTLGWDFQ